MLKSKEENPMGLHHRYNVKKADGTPVDPENEYFLLKLKGKGSKGHIEASRKAILKYADEIEFHKPKLANDIREKYQD